MEKSKFSFSVILGAMTALSIALPPAINAQDVASRTTIITACGKLFSIDANADGLSPEQRASIVQKNLDNALIAAKDRTANAVKVATLNNNPIVTLDNFYIVTADANSAERSYMTQIQLANKWADSIRMCLADTASVEHYVAMLTGRYPKAKIARESAYIAAANDVAVMPWGSNLPVQLSQSLDTDAMHLNDTIEAVLTTDVPLQPHFNSYLPAGTVALGHLVDAGPFNPNHFAGKHALMLNFFALKTPDGKEIPINGHILGGANTWRYASAKPIQPNCLAECNSKATITSDTISFGPTTTNVTSTQQTTAPLAQKGTIVGAWRGLPEDVMTQDSFHRLLLSRDTGLVVPAGEPLMLQLNASSTIAINSAAPASGIQVSSVGIGM